MELDENQWFLLLHKLGFGKAIEMDISVPKELIASDGVLPRFEHLSSSEPIKVALANGYAIQATAIQLISIYSSFFNGGYVVHPHVLATTSVEKRRVFSKITANEIKEALHTIGDEVCTNTRFVKHGRFVDGVYNTLCMRVITEEGKIYLHTKIVIRQPDI